MMPNNIVLIRHGESEGNANPSIRSVKPDYAHELSENGIIQAREAGAKLRQILGNVPVAFYCSPFFRTRQTYLEIRNYFDYSTYKEDPRLREQEWGHLRDMTIAEKIEDERDSYGHFYYRLPDGESCADVYDRVSDFLQTLHRDFQNEWFSGNVIIVCHGMTLRLFLMRWFHYDVEKFEMMSNPKNCEFHIMKLDTRGEKPKYNLITTPMIYEQPTHPYQFVWPKI
jgi:broad specificity phosphatase PhoE